MVPPSLDQTSPPSPPPPPPPPKKKMQGYGLERQRMEWRVGSLLGHMTIGTNFRFTDPGKLREYGLNRPSGYREDVENIGSR